MQQLVYALNDIKRDLNVITQKLAAVDRVIKTGDVSLLMQPIQGGQRRRNRKSGLNGQPSQHTGQVSQVFGQPSSAVPGLWGASSTGGKRRRNRNRKGQQGQFSGQFGGQQTAFNGSIPQNVIQQAQLTAQYLQQMLKQPGAQYTG